MAHRELAVLKTLVGASVAIACFIGLTGGAVAPGFGPDAPRAAAVLVADVAPADDLNIAYGNLFQSQSFVGPNRALKQDRARPQADAVSVAQSFDSIRARIAAIRLAKENPAAVPAMPPVVEVASLDTNAGAETASIPATQTGPQAVDPIVVAAIDPAVSSSALDAIDQMVAPVPQMMSQKLAYARADLPATEFDGLGKDKYGNTVTAKDLKCMAEAIYFEARSESYRGQIAVGQVVMNRVAHRLYPDDICAVVFQNEDQRNACQFSFACDGLPERITEQKAWDQAMEIARGVISGTLYVPEVGYATHYHATYVYPAWAPHMKKVTKIGMHVFYQFRRGWRFG